MNETLELCVLLSPSLQKIVGRITAIAGISDYDLICVPSGFNMEPPNNERPANNISLNLESSPTRSDSMVQEATAFATD